MATWTYAIDKIDTIMENPNGSVLIKVKPKSLPLIHVDRFQLLFPKTYAERYDDGSKRIVISFSRSDSTSPWVGKPINVNLWPKSSVTAEALKRLDVLTLKEVLRIAKYVNPGLKVVDRVRP